jgi:hypothetical protein
VNVADAPDANVTAVHVIVPPAPTAGVVHENAGPLFCDSETNVISPGNVSLSATSWAASGPAFATVIVNVTSLSGGAAAGPVFVTARSASGVGMKADVVALLFSSFGSGVSLVANAVFVIAIVGSVFEGTFSTNVKVAVAFAGSDAIVQTMSPGAPACGVVHENVGPLFCVMETKVVSDDA